LIENIKSIGLTTNGITGKRHFAKLRDAGLTHVNISLDTLIPGKFEFISRRRGKQDILCNFDRMCFLTCCLLMSGSFRIFEIFKISINPKLGKFPLKFQRCLTLKVSEPFKFYLNTLCLLKLNIFNSIPKEKDLFHTGLES